MQKVSLLLYLVLHLNHVSLSNGWQSANKPRRRHHPNLDMTTMTAVAFALQLFLFPIDDSHALTTTSTSSSSNNKYQREVVIRERFQCPESFATQSLGIQNIPRSPAVTTIRQVQKPKPSSSSSSSSSTQCTSNESNNNQQQTIVRGLIYMPSSTTASRETAPTSDLDTSPSTTLFITVSTANKPSAVVAGAQIPMSQIQDFPISFSLGRSNMLLPKENEEFFFQNDDLYVTAEIRSSPSSSSSSGGVELLRGRGLARLLQLPTTDDETTMSIRAAASIRLSRSSSADVLYSW